jgi:hypothetical protein
MLAAGFSTAANSETIPAKSIRGDRAVKRQTARADTPDATSEGLTYIKF